MDYYALLQEHRRPWLDPEALKERFLRRSAEVHPDRFHSADAEERRTAESTYSDLNRAYQVLREPRTRLPYLLELETGAPPRDIQKIPPGTLDLFMEVGEVCRQVDAFLGERQKATSPMVKARLFQQGLEWADRLKALQQTIDSRSQILDQELRELNAVWEEVANLDAPQRIARLPLARLEEIYRALSYGSRWTTQIQERMVQLASF